MPRKQKVEKQTITVIVNGKPIAVTLYPPTTARRTWYAYWPGLTFSKSTGHANLQDAVVAAEEMIRGGGKKATVADAVLSDEEFEQIQRAHFARKQDPAAQARAAKTLRLCLEAIEAFKAVTELKPITVATPDACADFQRKALSLPKNWRHRYPNSKEEVECVSPNTVLKWSRALQAAFERANRHAQKKKCIRGIVPEDKLLKDNPWNQFPWIEGRKRPIRQFDADELLSFLSHLETKWKGVTVAQAVAKTCLWSSCRRSEVMSLVWSSLRVIGNEYHFAIVGKAEVEKWFRIPIGLYCELLSLKTDSPFVFASYNGQLRKFYAATPRPYLVQLVGPDFKPDCLGDWFHERIVEWSTSLPKGQATTHIFRKTSLQYARAGEDVNRRVAEDARVSEGVLMTNYVKETDEQLRQKSNRTYERILASLPAQVADRYGYVEVAGNTVEERLKRAIAAKDWAVVAELSAQLAQERQQPTG